MRKARFTDEKRVLILQEADRTSVAAVARKYGVSEQTLYNWRKHFSGLAPSDVKRLLPASSRTLLAEPCLPA